MNYELLHQRTCLDSSKLLDRLCAWATPAWAMGPTLQAIRNGFLLCLPLVVIGALAVLLNNLPLPFYQNAMRELFGEKWQQGFFALAWQGSFGILSLPMVIGICYSLVQTHNQSQLLMPANPVTVSVVATGSFVVLLPSGNFTAYLGVQGLFVGILVSVAATRMFLYFTEIKALHMRIHSEGMPSSPQAFSCLAAGVLTVLCFAVVEIFFRQTLRMSVHDAIHGALLFPLRLGVSDDMLSTGVFYVILTHLCWFFGLHGSNVLAPLTQNVFEAATQANLAAHVQGMPLPHIVTKNFLDTFVFMGGAGTSLCLLAAILIENGKHGNARFAKISLVPGLFNINEIVLFGLPVILNPVYLFPFIFVPLALTLISFFAIFHGLVPPPVTPLDWTTPPVLSGLVATLDIRGGLLQIFNLVVGTLIYLPFVKVATRLKEARHKETQRELLEIACSNVVGPLGKKCLDRDDEVGELARTLAYDLEIAMKTGDGLYLEYQPQVDGRTGRVLGTEALVRWRHPVLGLVPAPIIVAISEDAEFIRPLGLWVLDEAAAERARWHVAGMSQDFKTSVNVSIQQLDDTDLPEKIVQCLDRHALGRSMIGIEVTESIALDPDSQHNRVLNQIHEQGLAVAIDDFGMGHSSLVYLKHFPVDVLKIDKVLSKDVVHSKTCKEIVATIVDLCRALNIRIVVEFVDNQEQKEALERLGCHIFQGYYYSRPLPGDKMLDYALGMNAAADERSKHAPL
jgi:lactose/cellobiose-specific phosphotransferase system IIC component